MAMMVDIFRKVDLLCRKIVLYTLNQNRTLIKNVKMKGGIQYYGFKYFPRDPDFKDPPYEPTKLFLIRRIKEMRGRNKYEKQSLAFLNIDGKTRYSGHLNIVKNIPEVNAVLWKVKHLIEIIPIQIKNGLPEDSDYSCGYLHDDGQFIVTPKLKVNSERLEAAEKFENNVAKMDTSTLEKFMRDRWNNPYTGGF